MPNINLDPIQQVEIVNFVEQCFNDRDNQMVVWRERMSRVYSAVSTFESPKSNPWDTTFKVNKAHTIENKNLPKIIGRSPRWMVKHRSYEEAMDESNEVDLWDLTKAIQAYLTNVFKKQDLREVSRVWAKGWMRFGIGRVKMGHRYVIQRTSKDTEEMDETTMKKKLVRKVKQAVAERYPTMEYRSYTDIYLNPVYRRFEDMPGIIDLLNNVRLSEFTKHPDKYMNLQSIVSCSKWGGIGKEAISVYRERILQLTGLNFVTKTATLQPNNLQVKQFYWLYDLSEEKDGSEERLYRFTTVGGMFLAEAEEISFIPYEDFRCFEDTETYLATGALEPIISLQEELNFKKNAKSKFINQSLSRDWIWSPSSGIDPRKLNGWPGNIVITNVDAETAMANLKEIEYRPVPPEIFSEENDFERQIQEASYTMDVASVRTDESMVNTATWVKAAMYDINSVWDDVRARYEEALVRAAYKLLQFTFDNLKGNIYIKELDWDWYREVHKEAMRDAISRYEIEVIPGSSSFDNEEVERSEKQLQRKISTEARDKGVPVDLKERYAELMGTFEGVNKDKLFEVMPIMGDQLPGQPSQVPSI